MPRGIILFAALAFALGAYAGAQSKPAKLGNWNRTPDEVAAGLHSPLPAEVAKPRPQRVFDAKFGTLAVTSLGSAAADITLARQCEAAHTCREGNPLMRGSAAIPFGLGLAVADNLFAYAAKKHHNRYWYLPQAATLAFHAVGIGSDVAAGAR